MPFDEGGLLAEAAPSSLLGLLSESFQAHGASEVLGSPEQPQNSDLLSHARDEDRSGTDADAKAVRRYQRRPAERGQPQLTHDLDRKAVRASPREERRAEPGRRLTVDGLGTQRAPYTGSVFGAGKDINVAYGFGA